MLKPSENDFSREKPKNFYLGYRSQNVQKHQEKEKKKKKEKNVIIIIYWGDKIWNLRKLSIIRLTSNLVFSVGAQSSIIIIIYSSDKKLNLRDGEWN